MSFGINGPDNLPSIQKSHHTNDGGAGNLGYFQRERKKKDQEQKEENDVFELSSKKDDDENYDNIEINLDSIGKKIKDFWFNLHNNSNNEKNPEVK